MQPVVPALSVGDTLQRPGPIAAALQWFSNNNRCRTAAQAHSRLCGAPSQAVALACCYADEWPLLIVVPATLRVHWADELQRYVRSALTQHVLQQCSEQRGCDDALNPS